MGLLNQVFETVEKLEGGARAMAAEIARNAPLATQGAKEVFLNQDRLSMDMSLKYNAARSNMILPSRDTFEAVAAYMQKKEPQFNGE